MEFDTYSKKYIHYYSSELTPLLKKTIESNEIKSLVDLGCGDGSILYALKNLGLLDEFETVYAIDLSQERINNAIKIDTKIIPKLADACKIKNMHDCSVDFIISNQVIEHVKDDELMIQEINRILKNGGFVYLSTVFKKWYGWYFYKDYQNNWVIDPTHMREYTKDMQLIDKLVKNNFKIMESCKTLQWFPISDFFLKRIGFKQDVYERNTIFRRIRDIRIPIVGYYNWEILCKKV
jgi:2-polyprenyl-3-methyl-5-hydroxy-6-metoxy-1,4-benzoquinol methylase